MKTLPQLYQDASSLLEKNNYQGALAICSEVLSQIKDSRGNLFIELKVKAEKMAQNSGMTAKTPIGHNRFNTGVQKQSPQKTMRPQENLDQKNEISQKKQKVTEQSQPVVTNKPAVNSPGVPNILANMMMPQKSPVNSAKTPASNTLIKHNQIQSQVKAAPIETAPSIVKHAAIPSKKMKYKTTEQDPKKKEEDDKRKALIGAEGEKYTYDHLIKKYEGKGYIRTIEENCGVRLEKIVTKANDQSVQNPNKQEVAEKKSLEIIWANMHGESANPWDIYINKQKGDLAYSKIIEVKSTASEKETTAFFSENEIAEMRKHCDEKHKDKYIVARVNNALNLQKRSVTFISNPYSSIFNTEKSKIDISTDEETNLANCIVGIGYKM